MQMKKYTKKTIDDYIKGNDIEDFELDILDELDDQDNQSKPEWLKKLDALENDPEFMADVVCTNKELYSLCSDKIKSDYTFVKKLLDFYKDDLEFAKKIYAGFNPKDKESEDIRTNIYEINIIMSKISKGEDEDIYNTCITMANLFYNADQMEFEESKKDYNYKIQEAFGLGFIYQRHLYHYNNTIMNFVVENYISEIFSRYINLELELHKKYDNYEEFEKLGKHFEIINYISYYDAELAEYVAANTSVLSEIDKKIKRIKNNWNAYEHYLQKENEEYEKLKYERIIQRIFEYFDDNNVDSYILLGYVSEQFGVKEEIRKCLECDRDITEAIFEQIDSHILSEEEGYEIIDKQLKEMCNKAKVTIDVFEDYRNLPKNVHILEDMKHIKEVQKIFYEELECPLNNFNKNKSVNNRTKLIKFKKNRKPYQR